MSDERSAYPRFIVPTWPGEPFVLIAERGKFEYGPFEAGDFAVSKDNALYYSDGASHPIQLRISLQVGDLEGVTPAVLEGALIAVEPFARLGDVIRTATIAQLLPELLEPGEELVAVSTSSNGSSPFDIEIDRRVGCLRLTRWARVGDDRKGLLRDYAKLAAEPSQRRAELYVLGEWAEQLLRSGVRSDTALGHSSAATSLMTPFGDLSTPFQDFSDVPDERVSIIDIGPTLARLIGQGPGSASDSLLGRSDECRVERDKTLAAGVLDWLLARVGRLLVPVPKPAAKSWYHLPIGTSRARIVVVIHRAKGRVGCRLAVTHSRGNHQRDQAELVYEGLRNDRLAIESELGLSDLRWGTRRERALSRRGRSDRQPQQLAGRLRLADQLC